MFCGLIEKVSKVENITFNQNGANISFKADFENVKIGDSIAVNGVCLTVVKIEKNLFSADIMNETLKISNLNNLKKADEINLERAMKLSDRIDGHIVTGHIDCLGKVSKITQDGFSKRIQFNCDSTLIVKKGSISINGVSLTVSNLFNDGFEVSLIPETLNKTNLKNLKINDNVNIEYDILGKYVQKMLNPKKESKITLEFLRENGF